MRAGRQGEGLQEAARRLWCAVQAALCTGARHVAGGAAPGVRRKQGLPMGYKGCVFHRIIKACGGWWGALWDDAPALGEALPRAARGRCSGAAAVSCGAGFHDPRRGLSQGEVCVPGAAGRATSSHLEDLSTLRAPSAADHHWQRLQGDGTGSFSIYGSRFQDETFEGKHTGAGLLSMVSPSGAREARRRLSSGGGVGLRRTGRLHVSRCAVEARLVCARRPTAAPTATGARCAQPPGWCTASADVRERVGHLVIPRTHTHTRAHKPARSSSSRAPSATGSTTSTW